MAGQFPAGFSWGAATSAYQVEGAVRTDGRGETIWDRFTRRAGAIADGSTGDVACDSYDRYPEDIALLTQMGCRTYRFSTAWARIFPDGYGRLNRAGLDYYERLRGCPARREHHRRCSRFTIGTCRRRCRSAAAGLSRDTVSAFAEYADTLSRRLGDRVPLWATINEPWVAAHLGHVLGIHAPGVRSLKTGLQVAHHLLLAHGEAVPVLRGNTPQGTQIGIVLNLTPTYPATDRGEDDRAAERMDGAMNRWYLDPLYRGQYPDDLMELYAADAPETQTTDMTKIAVPTDFLGINYYSRALVREANAAPLMAAQEPPAAGGVAHGHRLGSLPGGAVRHPHPRAARLRPAHRVRHRKRCGGQHRTKRRGRHQ